MSLEGRRVVVTGGAGFIGSHLVERLSRRNRVRVIDDLSSGSVDNLRHAPAASLVVADISEAAAIEEPMRSAEIVFHLAASCLRTSLGDPHASLRANDAGTLNVLMAALHAGVQRFVYVSSSEVYGNALQVPMDEEHPLHPRTPYAAGKLAGEAYALSFHRTYGLPVTAVRPFNSYGPRSHLAGASGEVIPKFVARCLAGEPLVIFGDGEQTRDFTWIEDTVRGIELAAESPALEGEVVNVARGVEVSILEVAASVQRLLGCRVPILHGEARPGDVARHAASVDKARRVLGFSAEVDFEDGLAMYVDWVRSLPGSPREWLLGEEVVNWRLASSQN